MATRFYLQNAAPGASPATNRGAWDDAASKVFKGLSRTKSGAVASLGVAEAVTTADYDVMILKLVSDEPIPAQTISGTVNVIIGAQESHVQQNAHWHLHIYVTQGDTDTLRGTLLTDYTEAAGTNEWTTTAQGRALDAAQTLSSLAISANDRIVVEVGYVSRNTSATSRTGTLWYGGTGGDLTVAGDETTLVGSIEFSANLFSVEHAGAAVLAATATVAPKGARTFAAAAVLAGAGTLAGAAVRTLSGAAVLSGTGTLTPAGSVITTHAAAAALTGAGSLAGASAVERPGSALLAGSGALSGAPALEVPGAAVLAGSGALAAVPDLTLGGVAVLPGTGALSGASAVDLPAASSLAGAGSMAASGALDLGAGAGLLGAASLTASGLADYGAAAVLDGVASVDASASGAAEITGAAVLAGSGDILARGGFDFLGAAVLAGTGSISASEAFEVPGAAVLAGQGFMDSASTIDYAAEAVLVGAGDVAAEPFVKYRIIPKVVPRVHPVLRARPLFGTPGSPRRERLGAERADEEDFI